jgi:hypothetical protein
MVVVVTGAAVVVAGAVVAGGVVVTAAGAVVTTAVEDVAFELEHDASNIIEITQARRGMFFTP